MKKLVVAMLMVMMAVGVSACGNDASTKESIGQNSVEQSSEEVSNEVSQESKEETKEANELPNWKGVYDHIGRAVVDKGSFGIDIAYPSLKPASSGFAYQKDPALVLVSTTGINDNWEEISVDKVEDTFPASKEWIISKIDPIRNHQYGNYDFVIEEQESLTINGMPACKYVGKHTYTFDNAAQEIPFVAYSFYTDQMENYSYYTVVVIDDSINNPTMDPLPEGTIEAYAKKMVESVKID